MTAETIDHQPTALPASIEETTKIKIDLLDARLESGQARKRNWANWLIDSDDSEFRHQCLREIMEINVTLGKIANSKVRQQLAIEE